MIAYTAYEILGLEPNASQEQIKEAYAVLSKKYHPEENPEEFQQIHEAYVTLVRRSRRKTDHTFVPMPLEEPLQNDSFVVDVPNLVHETEEKSYDFDEVEYKVQQEKEEAYYQQLEMALQRLDKIVLANGSVYKDLLKSIFEEVPLEIIGNRVFIEKLISVLNNAKIDNDICRVIKNGVRFWDENLHGEHIELLEELDAVLKSRIEKNVEAENIAKLPLVGLLGVILIGHFLKIAFKPMICFGIFAVLLIGVYKLCRIKFARRISFGAGCVGGLLILAIVNWFNLLKGVMSTYEVETYSLILALGLGGLLISCIFEGKGK